MNNEYQSRGRYDRSPGGGQGGGYGGGRGGYGGGGGGEHRERRGMPLSELPVELTEVSRKAIGAAIEVHRALGPGYSAELYRDALLSELHTLGVKADVDYPFDVSYKGRKMGVVHADLFVDKKFLVMLMNRPGEIGGLERAKLRAQLKTADLELGLIINFGERRLKDGLVRVLNIEKLSAGKMKDEEGDHDEDDGHAGADEGRTVNF